MMKIVLRIVLLLLLCIILQGLRPVSLPAEDLDIVNRPVNSSGLTGILHTTAPYTTAKGTYEIGFSIISESSVTPDYSILEYPLSVTVGITDRSEIALRASFYNIKEGPTVTAPTNREAGNVELSYKWNFFPTVEGSMRPALALIAAAYVPQESNSDIRVNAVSHWGMRLGFSAGSELTWRDHMLAVYTDAVVTGQDITEDRLRDTYETYNAGLLFPISKYRNLQLLSEYTLVHGKKTITVEGGDYSSMTYGLRMVSDKFNITMGAQFLRKRVQGFENSNKIIGSISMKF